MNIATKLKDELLMACIPNQSPTSYQALLGPIGKMQLPYAMDFVYVYDGLAADSAQASYEIQISRLAEI